MTKTTKYIASITTFIFLLILGIATFIEKKSGSRFVSETIYHSWWFICLLALLFLSYIVNLLCSKNEKVKLHTLFIFISIGLILLGGLLSFLSSQSTSIHLVKGEYYDNKEIIFPFKIKLTDFEVACYQGTNSPMNFISKVEINDNNNIHNETISMNKILKYKSYKLYQYDYDEDMQGSVLLVVNDKYGTPCTYFAYALLFVSIMVAFFNKTGKYKQIVSKVSLMIVFALFICQHSFAQKTVSTDIAEKMGKISIYHNGRIAPLDTYSKEFLTKISGKSYYKSFNSMQVLSGFMFYPQDWYSEPVIKLKNSQLKQQLNGNNYIDFNKLSTIKSYLSNNVSIREVDQKYNLIYKLYMGGSLKIFPNGNKWIAPNDNIASLSPSDSLFVSGIWMLFFELATEDDMSNVISKLQIYQHAHAEPGCISNNKIKIELLFNKTNLTKILLILNLTASIFALALLLINKKNQFRLLYKSLFYVILISFIAISLVIAIRWYISGHIPLAGIYDTLLFVAFTVLLITLLLHKSSNIVPFCGLLLSGLVLTVANLNGINPKITPLMPVLNTPWLMIHVGTIMIAYSLFAFTFIISLLFLVMYALKLNTSDFERITNLSKVFLYPGAAILALGICFGAVWANISWGRYWAWDPKEVWALITLIIYCIIVQEDNLPFLRKPLYYHISTAIAFLSVVMTYFGVNYLLSGIHSYGG